MRNVLFAAFVLAGILPLASLFKRDPILHSDPKWQAIHGEWLARHAELECFAQGVLEHTESRARIRYVLPDDVSDQGLMIQRIRYLAPGRYFVETDAVAPGQYVAAWREPPPPGNVIWSGCGGVLVRR